MPKGTEMALPV